MQVACDVGSGPVIGADLRTPAKGDEAAARRHRLPGTINEQLQPSLQGVLGSIEDIRHVLISSCCFETINMASTEKCSLIATRYEAGLSGVSGGFGVVSKQCQGILRNGLGHDIHKKLMSRRSNGS